jgi:hypothetical protein
MDAERGFWDSKDGFGISAEVSRLPGLSPSRRAAEQHDTHRKFSILPWHFFPLLNLQEVEYNPLTIT